MQQQKSPATLRTKRTAHRRKKPRQPSRLTQLYEISSEVFYLTRVKRGGVEEGVMFLNRRTHSARVPRAAKSEGKLFSDIHINTSAWHVDPFSRYVQAQKNAQLAFSQGCSLVG